jgi:hypothetical protein
MATTTNYSWSTPDDTALVKDGAAAIRSLGTAIDSTVFTNAGAAIAKTIVDAKGDIIVATASDTVSRLAVGANDTVLVADSAQATGLKWAAPASGGMTLLSTTTLSGTTTTISGISGSYNTLLIILQGVTNGTADEAHTIKPNGANIATYSFVRESVVANDSGAAIQLTNINMERSAAQNAWAMTIDNYASTSHYKSFNYFGSWRLSGAGKSIIGGGGLATTSAITSIDVVCGGGYSYSGGQVLIYGVK